MLNTTFISCFDSTPAVYSSVRLQAVPSCDLGSHSALGTRDLDPWVARGDLAGCSGSLPSTDPDRLAPPHSPGHRCDLTEDTESSDEYMENIM